MKKIIVAISALGIFAAAPAAFASTISASIGTPTATTIPYHINVAASGSADWLSINIGFVPHDIVFQGAIAPSYDGDLVADFGYNDVASLLADLGSNTITLSARVCSSDYVNTNNLGDCWSDTGDPDLAIATPVSITIGSCTGAGAMSSSTLGCAIDNTNQTAMDYFNVLLLKYWPFVVGFLILCAAWYFGKKIIAAFN